MKSRLQPAELDPSYEQAVLCIGAVTNLQMVCGGEPNPRYRVVLIY
jgi:hypothetical protein